jgi:hypothetical protein
MGLSMVLPLVTRDGDRLSRRCWRCDGRPGLVVRDGEGKSKSRCRVDDSGGDIGAVIGLSPYPREGDRLSRRCCRCEGKPTIDVRVGEGKSERRWTCVDDCDGDVGAVVYGCAGETCVEGYCCGTKAGACARDMRCVGGDG